MGHATPKRLLYNQSYDELQETAWRLSRQILEMTTKAGSGHPSSSLKTPENYSHIAKDRISSHSKSVRSDC
jgi:transketolase N-terminal domain/subunit